MRSIFIGSTGGGSGQTLAAWALAVKLREKRKQVGFFKPYGLLPRLQSSGEGSFGDSDVLLLKEVLGLSESEDLLCPVLITEDLIPAISGGKSQELLERIKQAYQTVSAGKDVVLIMGAREIFFGGELSGLSDSLLVKSFDSSVLLVDHYQRDNMTLYSLLSLNSFLDGRVKSAIINHLPGERMEDVKNKVIPFLQEKGLKFILPVPEDPVLAASSVSAIAELIEGQILCCRELAGNLIRTSTIGSRHLNGPLAIFKQVYNKVVLVGLSQPGSEEGVVGGIVLTSGKSPSELILRKAREQSIPLILTLQDTFQTVEFLEKAKPALRLQDEFKVRRFLNLLEQEVEIDSWLEALL